jgi:hypothetical protein
MVGGSIKVLWVVKYLQVKISVRKSKQIRYMNIFYFTLNVENQETING